MLQPVSLWRFFLLLLYAEAAWLSTVKTALHKLRAPWGICVELNLKARLFSFCFFVLQMVGGGSDKMLQRLLGSAWLSSGVQQNPFFCIRAVLLLSNYCISRSMQCLDSTAESATAKWARATVWCVTSSVIWRPQLKGSWEWKKVHFCDATSWNVVLLAEGSSSEEKKPLVRSFQTLVSGWKKASFMLTTHKPACDLIESHCQLVKSFAFSGESQTPWLFLHFPADLSDGCTPDGRLLRGSGGETCPSVCRDGCRLCSVLYCIAGRRLTLWNNMCPSPAGPRALRLRWSIWSSSLLLGCHLIP